MALYKAVGVGSAPLAAPGMPTIALFAMDDDSDDDEEDDDGGMAAGGVELGIMETPDSARECC